MDRQGDELIGHFPTIEKEKQLELPKFLSVSKYIFKEITLEIPIFLKKEMKQVIRKSDEKLNFTFLKRNLQSKSL